MADNTAKQKPLAYEQKAAAVVAALGVDAAAEVYRYLSQEEVEQLTLEVAKLNHLNSDQTEEVLEEFYRSCMTQKVVTDGGMEYARAVLERTYGEAVAMELLAKTTKFLKGHSFDFLNRMDAKHIYAALQRERLQATALVLSYIEPDKAASLIAELSEDKRIKVVERIAKLESASPEIVKIVEAQLLKRFDKILNSEVTTIGGIDYVADVMNYMDRSNEKFIFEEMGKENPELADSIRKKMFVFSDILSMDDRSVQRFIRDCDTKDLVYALKNAGKELSELFFSNMSARMAETIQSDIEVTFNIRLRDVEEAQQKIVNLIRKLDEEGEIMIGKGGKDDVVV